MRGALATAGGLLIVGTLSFGGAISLIGQMYHLSGDEQMVMYLWFCRGDRFSNPFPLGCGDAGFPLLGLLLAKFYDPGERARRTRRLKRGCNSVYPYPHVDEVIGLMNAGSNALPYLDIPFQHAAPEVLKAMKRPAAQDKTLARIKTWRDNVPRSHTALDLHCRLPRRDRERFPVSARLAGRSADRPRRRVQIRVRGRRDLQCHRQCSARRNQAAALERTDGAPAENLGAPLEAQGRHRQQIIIDEVGLTVSKGRSKADAPDIDGSVYITARRPLKVGEIVTAKIERADDYDLHGTVAGF